LVADSIRVKTHTLISQDRKIGPLFLMFSLSETYFVLVKPFDKLGLMGFQENLTRKRGDAQLLEDVKQVNFCVQLISSF
jgi:hypothetical protein